MKRNGYAFTIQWRLTTNKEKYTMNQMSLSIEEACSVTGIGRTKLYDAINRGELIAKKFGKRTIILRDDLEAFLKSLETYPANPKG